MLLLGHLIGDFILQPKKLVQWKYESKFGILAHTLIHFCIYALLFWKLPLSLPIAAVLILVTISHFIIDQIKIHYEKSKNRPSYIESFLVDQFAHLAVIILASCVLTSDSVVYSVIILGISAFIISTYVVDIYKFQKQREKNSKTEFCFNYKSMLKKFMLIFGVCLIILFLSSPLKFL